VAQSAGATYINLCSGLGIQLPDILVEAMNHKGLSIVETLGMCTGRHTKRNRLTPKVVDEMIDTLPRYDGVVTSNIRPEYGEQYQKLAKEKAVFPEPVKLKQQTDPSVMDRQEIVILGSLSMWIVTAGDIVCYAGISSGMNASMKNDYNITVLRGSRSVTIILSSEKIGYTGIEALTIVLALSDEGVQ
jgi:2-oxoglutarate/2-oxoacid ferredoxin oxidoreductase subunit beta